MWGFPHPDFTWRGVAPELLISGPGVPKQLVPEGWVVFLESPPPRMLYGGAAPGAELTVSPQFGAVVGTEGDTVTLGGGTVGASFDTRATQGTPEACGHHYWLVAP